MPARLLLDSCMAAIAAPELRRAGHDVIWAGDWPQDPGDEAILSAALADQRILVTIDKDFGELAVRHRHRHAGIIRIVGASAQQQAEWTLLVLDKVADDLAKGALVTVEAHRIRVRRLEY